jgi:hypothetical protein
MNGRAMSIGPYHYLLFNFFLYDGALVKSAARRDQEGRDA